VFDPAQITITAAQLEQLQNLRYEEKGAVKSVVLRDSPNLGSGYIVAGLRDGDGQPIGETRVLAPS
jgi:hypothetical protein